MEQAGRSYSRDHCVKVAWYAAFTTMHKAGCNHLEPIANGSVVPTIEGEAQDTLRPMRRTSNAFIKGFWNARWRDARYTRVTSNNAGTT